MKAFEYDNYKKFLIQWIENRPRKGRGELQKISQFLNIHSTMISHVVRGDKNLSLEQGCNLAEYLGLNELETDYFLNLIQLERAGSHKLKQRIQNTLNSIREKSLQVKNRLPQNVELSENDKGIFYSNWIYSALRLLTSIEGFQDRQELIKAYDYPPKLVNEILEFLLDRGLCLEENERILMGPSKTHLSKESPLVWKHHKNWRIKAMERHQRLDEEELIFSAPLTISKVDMVKVKEKILQLIEEVSSVIDQTNPDQLACLNIDWVNV